METLATTLKDTELTDEEKELATAKALEVSRQMENEVNIETLVKAKGFADCLCVLRSVVHKVFFKSHKRIGVAAVLNLTALSYERLLR